MFVCAKRRAKKKQLEFDITESFIWDLYLQQRAKCVYTNTKMTLTYAQSNDNTTSYFKHPHNVSIDRINSSLGYTKDNVQLVTAEVNIMKGRMRHNHFLHMCQAITKHHQHTYQETQ